MTDPASQKKTRCALGRTRRALFALVASAALSLLAAGCASAPSAGVASVTSSSPGRGSGVAATESSRTHTLVVAGRCLREHGLSGLPDPTIATSGPAKGRAILDKRALLAFSDTVVSRAMRACQTDLQEAGLSSGSSTSVKTPQQIRDGLAFARCVRHHGIANFPDPTAEGNFDLSGTGINPHALTPAQLAAARACLSAAHGAVHIPQQNAGSTGGQ